MSVTDEYLKNNESYAAERFPGPLSGPPSSHVAVVACMDSRMDIYAILGLRPGEANVIRNAGGVVTDQEIRSLAISQRLLGTREIILIHHTDCPLLNITDDTFKEQIQSEAGTRPSWPVETFPDLAGDLRCSMARVRFSAFLPHRDAVRGFIYDVTTGRLQEVT
ncbi:beta-class carbonic anhydrase [Streptomyces camelliae]|uniref:carbonic anhydrase n=1 Tax=Streptomyces camelliae TaxID=3004093 RepID=A0ABY7NW60_9ACTN|nr:carbonic anhydrase [Streptomyces sp. HUAS 2-6]WBO61707.1 carbonic anhydrase [Streptomyces sp. HUAS 2-6]